MVEGPHEVAVNPLQESVPRKLDRIDLLVGRHRADPHQTAGSNAHRGTSTNVGG